MNKWLVQLVLVISSVILMSGCNSGGSETAEEEADILFGPLPAGLPVFVDIVEPYLNTSKSNENAISLYSYKPQENASDLPTKTEVFSAGSKLITSLNTRADSMGKNEFTLIVKNDSVYSVNHLNDEIRLLNHFTTSVCEILPIEKVIESVDQLTNERVLTILDDERVYVVTADDGSSINACNFDSKKRYYELSLDYQFESSLIVDGDINSIALVKESLARSKLIFGWIPDVNDPNQEKEVMSYAYLGYDGEAKDLTLFDKDQEVIWTQKRELETFDIVNLGQGNISTKYMLNIRPLYNLYYIVQLGLDVFVVDSGKELLSKVQSEVDTILTDKVVTITAYGDSTNSIVPIVENGFDDENLFIIDKAKIYHSSYLADAPPRNPSQVTKFIGQNPTGFDRKAQLINRSFSQFDLKECLEDDLACYAANDVESQAWQFFTPCEEQYGCEITDDENDFCETLAEKLQTQSDQVLCTPSDYQHISELNDEANDAKLLAYMQYNEKYIRQRIFTSNHDQLFVTARMNHKDVFLTYNFKMDFSQPKALRERVLFGKRASLFGMDAYINDGNLYLTALQQSSIRSNECYKYGQNVTCELGNMEDAGPPIICTGKDLAEGLCFNQFKEYESKAFFCSAEQLENLSCSDANLSQLNDLAVEDEEEDGKWLNLFNYSDMTSDMYLLAGNHTLAVDNNKLDEGRLYNPSLYRIDQTTGQKEALITNLEGLIERVSNGWLSKEPELGVSEVFGHINVISDEIIQTGGSKLITESSLVTYLLEQTFENSSSLTPDFIKAPKVAERHF